MAEPTADTEIPAIPAPTVDDAEQPVAQADLLVEEVSIDGMCGVY